MRRDRRVMCAVLLWCATWPALAQQFTLPISVDDIVNEHLVRLEARQDITPAVRANIEEAYRAAIASLRTADEWQAQLNGYRERRQQAPADIEAAERALAEALPEPTIDTEASTIAEWEAAVRDTEAALEQARQTRIEIEREPVRRAERRRVIPEQQEQVRQQIEETRRQIEELSTSSESPELVEARRIQYNARLKALELELATYGEELQTYEARTRMLGLRLQTETRQEAFLDAKLNLLRERLAQERRAEAREAARRANEAQFAALNAPEPIRALAQELAQEAVDIAQLRGGTNTITERQQSAQARLDEVRRTLTDLETRFENIQRRVNMDNRSSVMGIVLRRERSGLPSVWEYRRERGRRQDEISQIQIEQLEWEDRVAELIKAEERVNDVVAQSASGASETEREQMAALLKELYSINLDALYGLIDSTDDYLYVLSELDAAERQLIAKTLEVRELIDEHIHWIRSGPIVGPSTFNTLWATRSDVVELFRYTMDPRGWWADLTRTPQATLAFIVALGIILTVRKRSRSRMDHWSVLQSAEETAGAIPALKAAGMTAATALLGPAVLWYVGWRLTVSVDIPTDTRPIGIAMLYGGISLYAIELLRNVLRKNGLAIGHFGWPAEECGRLRRDLRIIALLSTPLIVLIYAIEIADNSRLHESWGRLFFVALMAITIVFAARWLQPQKGIIHAILDWRRGHAVLRGRRFVYLVAIAIPLVLTITTLLGYYYSALRVGARIYITAFWIFVIFIGSELALHGLRAARVRWEKTQREKLSEDDDSPAEGDETLTADAINLESERMELQSQRLIRAFASFVFLFGIWTLWQSLFPAFEYLDGKKFWEIQVAGTNEEGLAIAQQVITWRDVIVAAVIALITLISVRNLPAILEIVFLQRFSMGAGERYAITTIFGYILGTIGFLWAFQSVGLSWSKVQWLVAALGIGLGFGLQEIFANFMSGLIILFERPIRVGDIVTIGDTSGTVSRIRIRATWITAFDRKELIVPNREFVTGRLTNWTLSDQVLRVEIPVGIAYGSDTGKARRIMMQVARKNVHVLKEPRPEIYFMSFGDNSLNFELRVYSLGPPHYLLARDQMHMAIDYAFREAGIQIAFPQRDIHIRSIDAAFPRPKTSSGEPEEADTETPPDS